LVAATLAAGAGLVLPPVAAAPVAALAVSLLPAVVDPVTGLLAHGVRLGVVLAGRSGVRGGLGTVERKLVVGAGAGRSGLRPVADTGRLHVGGPETCGAARRRLGAHTTRLGQAWRGGGRRLRCGGRRRGRLGLGRTRYGS